MLRYILLENGTHCRVLSQQERTRHKLRVSLGDYVTIVEDKHFSVYERSHYHVKA